VPQHVGVVNLNVWGDKYVELKILKVVSERMGRDGKGRKERGYLGYYITSNRRGADGTG
jgi:hypothetical protein